MSNKSDDRIFKQYPIKRVKLHELVVEKIGEMIKSGELKAGDRLPSERDLMGAFNIGRPAVREAFLSLQNKGLIITENGRRARVSIPSPDNIFETLDGVVGVMISETENLKALFDARVFVEAAMARYAAQAGGKRELDELKEALHSNEMAIGDHERFMQTDRTFHQILFRIAKNPVFDAAYTALAGWLMQRWQKLDRTEATEKVAYQGHLQVYRAVKKGDPDAAERAMRKHLASSWELWEKELSRES